MTEKTVHKTQDGNPVALTISQRRYLRASFTCFEKALRNADRLLNEGDEVGILYHRKMRLDAGQRQVLQGKINAALTELSALVKALGIRAAEEDASRIIMAEMSASWADLVDARSDHMSGYGAVNPGTALMLDPAIDRLAGMALEMSNMMQSNPKS